MNKVVALTLFLSCFVGFIGAIEYANQQQLVHSEGDDADYFLYWNVVEEVIQIKITAKTTGWIGFGLSPEGTMVNSDVVIGWVANNGDTFFDDRYAIQYSEPILDINMIPAGENNVQLLSISSIDGWTTIEFSRALDTGDRWDVPVVPGEMTIIWAMGYEGNNPASGKLSRHEFRAVNTVTFIPETFNRPDVLLPTCEGISSRKYYSGDSSDVVGLRVETLAGDIKLSSGQVTNVGVSVLESAYDQNDLDTIETLFVSPDPLLWTVVSGRGDAASSTPNSLEGPSSGSINGLNTTISSNECIGADMSVVIPTSLPYAHLSAFTHFGYIDLNGLNIASKAQVKTNGGKMEGKMTINSASELEISSEWGEVTLEVERNLDFEGNEKIRVVLVGFSGSYDVSTASGYSVSVSGDMVVPATGGNTFEAGYVGFQGQSSTLNITATCDIEVVFFHDADTMTVDLQMQNYNVPSRRTSYICANVDLPTDQDYHIVRIDAIKDQTVVLHHMVLFICENQQAASEPWDCSDMDPECTQMLYVWAVGGSNFYLPQEAGFPMGPTGAQYAILQIHYDNPDNLDYLWDNSGFRVYYTPNLRQYDAGILEVGLTDFVIPPGESAYTVGEPKFGCPAECTEKDIPEGGEMTVFASMLHAHLAGIQIYTQHFRDSENSTVQLEDLNNNPYYDFNVQEYDLFNPPKSILPGDSLVTYCVYNTEGRTEPTPFGLASTEEMCFNYIAYYPLGSMAYCLGVADHIAYCDDFQAVNSWDNLPNTQ